MIEQQKKKPDEVIRTKAEKGFSGPSRPLPFSGTLSQAFGRSFADVRAYTGPAATKANRAFGSRAYTFGNRIAFGSSPDLRTTAHEAAHIVQQSNGVRAKTLTGTPGDRYEKEADSAASSVLKGENASVSNDIAPPMQFILEGQTLSGADVVGGDWREFVYGDSSGVSSNRGRGHRARDFQRIDDRSQRTDSATGQRNVVINSRSLDSSMTDSYSPMDAAVFNLTGTTLRINMDRYIPFNLTPVPSPAQADVIQGSIGDCWLLATLLSMANSVNGRAQLLRIITESGDNYMVEYFRVLINSARVASVDPNMKIRVTTTKSFSSSGASSNTVTQSGLNVFQTLGWMTADLLEQYIEWDTIDKPAGAVVDTITGEVRKHILWPLIVEKTFATVVGNYQDLNSGLAQLSMMVLTGQVPDYLAISSMTIPQVGQAFGLAQTAVNDQKPVVALTRPGDEFVDSQLSNSCTVTNVDLTNGLSIANLNTPALTWTVSWGNAADMLDGPLMCISALGYDSFAPADLDANKNRILDHFNQLFHVLTTARKGRYAGDGLQIVHKHYYSVNEVTADNKLVLRNPWGRNHPGRSLTATDVHRYFNSIELVQ